jgi:Peptidase_C39 like family
MNKKITGIFIVLLLTISIFPSIVSRKDNENRVDKNINFKSDIFFIKGKIYEISKETYYLNFFITKIDIIEWSHTDGFIKKHLENQMVRWKKPFYGILMEGFILGIFLSPYISLSSIVISGPDIVNENEYASYICEGTFSDSTKIEIQSGPTWSVKGNYVEINNKGKLHALNIPGIIPNNQSVNIIVSSGELNASKTLTIRDIKYIIEGIDPPEKKWYVKEGDCGEACIWTILHYYNINVTEKDINIAGGDPGRGLHWVELFVALNHYGINYNDLSHKVSSYQDYEQHLQTNITNKVKDGHPLLISVKIYPNQHPEWAGDHFILIVGYTINDELIYNSFNCRKSIEISKLLNTEDGYSLINDYMWVGCIEFPLT